MVFSGLTLAGTVASAIATAGALATLQGEVSALQLAVGITQLENGTEDSQLTLLRNQTHFLSSNRTYLGTNDVTNPLLIPTDPPETNINSSFSVGSILKVNKSTNQILHTVPTIMKVNNEVLLETSLNNIALNKTITYNGKGTKLTHYYNANENINALADATIKITPSVYGLPKQLNDGQIEIISDIIIIGSETSQIILKGQVYLQQDVVIGGRNEFNYRARRRN